MPRIDAARSYRSGLRTTLLAAMACLVATASFAAAQASAALTPGDVVVYRVGNGGGLGGQGATTKGIKATAASVIRVCGAKAGSIKVSASTGPVVLGDGEGCAAGSYSAGANITNNTAGVSVVGNSFKGSVKVANNSGGTTVSGNTVSKNLTVTGNSGTVVDTPNTVGGKTKAQSRKLR